MPIEASRNMCGILQPEKTQDWIPALGRMFPSSLMYWALSVSLVAPKRWICVFFQGGFLELRDSMGCELTYRSQSSRKQDETKGQIGKCSGEQGATGATYGDTTQPASLSLYMLGLTVSPPNPLEPHPIDYVSRQSSNPSADTYPLG